MKHNFKEIEKLFDQRNIYELVIKKNIMFHKEIHHCIHDILKKHFGNNPVSVLDLACGEAVYIADTLKQTNVSYYCGVDLSSVSLILAKKNIERCDFHSSFSNCDFYQFIEESKETFDVVIIGHSLHHFDLPHKNSIFRNIKNILNKNGLFILFDLVREKNESKPQYSQRNYNYTAKRLRDDMCVEDLASVKKHIMTNDFPETAEVFFELARKNNFRSTELIFQDPKKLFGLFCFVANTCQART